MNARRTKKAAEEMAAEYDLGRMKIVRRGTHAFVPAGKTRITIRLDDDILDWFYTQVEHAGGGSYQAAINQALREYIAEQPEPLEKLLRRIVREELGRARKAS